MGQGAEWGLLCNGGRNEAWGMEGKSSPRATCMPPWLLQGHPSSPSTPETPHQTEPLWSVVSLVSGSHVTLELVSVPCKRGRPFWRRKILTQTFQKGRGTPWQLPVALDVDSYLSALPGAGNREFAIADGPREEEERKCHHALAALTSSARYTSFLGRQRGSGQFSKQ